MRIDWKSLLNDLWKLVEKFQFDFTEIQHTSNEYYDEQFISDRQL